MYIHTSMYFNAGFFCCTRSSKPSPPSSRIVSCYTLYFTAIETANASLHKWQFA